MRLVREDLNKHVNNKLQILYLRISSNQIKYFPDQEKGHCNQTILKRAAKQTK